MAWTTTRPIKSLDRGVNVGAGAYVAPADFTPERWASLVAEGVVVQTAVPAPPPLPSPGGEAAGEAQTTEVGKARRRRKDA